jgi:hypothetical protein
MACPFSRVFCEKWGFCASVTSALSFRPQPERQRRRSGGTCCLVLVEPDRVERTLLPASFDVDLDRSVAAWHAPFLASFARSGAFSEAYGSLV